MQVLNPLTQFQESNVVVQIGHGEVGVEEHAADEELLAVSAFDGFRNENSECKGLPSFLYPVPSLIKTESLLSDGSGPKPSFARTKQWAAASANLSLINTVPHLMSSCPIVL